MAKVVAVQLEWKYTPIDYLEKPIQISFKGGDLDIKDGVAIAKIDLAVFDSNSSIRDELTQLIENKLFAIQVTTYKGFDLSKPSRDNLLEDGRKAVCLDGTASCSMGGTATIAERLETKRDRLKKQEKIASLIDKYRISDVTLDHMLKSLKKSHEDPDNELVHLYEIRDSLSERFRGKKNAIEQLGLTNDEWDEIGKLANSLPLNQGRHRGKAAGSLRDAEEAELYKARKSADYLIEKYLGYLEKFSH